MAKMERDGKLTAMTGGVARRVKATQTEGTTGYPETEVDGIQLRLGQCYGTNFHGEWGGLVLSRSVREGAGIPARERAQKGSTLLTLSAAE